MEHQDALYLGGIEMCRITADFTSVPVYARYTVIVVSPLVRGQTFRAGGLFLYASFFHQLFPNAITHRWMIIALL